MQAGEPGQCGEAVVGAGPVDADRVEPGTAAEAAQDGGDDDGVVGVPEDVDEVRHQVDGQREVGQQQPKPDADAAGECLVSGQSPDEAQDVGQQPQRLARQPTRRG